MISAEGRGAGTKLRRKVQKGRYCHSARTPPQPVAGSMLPSALAHDQRRWQQDRPHRRHHDHHRHAQADASPGRSVQQTDRQPRPPPASGGVEICRSRMGVAPSDKPATAPPVESRTICRQIDYQRLLTAGTRQQQAHQPVSAKPSYPFSATWSHTLR